MTTEKPGIFEHEKYSMLLLPAVFIIGLIATIISVNIIGRTASARRAYCQSQVQAGKTPEPWCVPFLQPAPAGQHTK